jgi:hypothetical protein
MWSANDEEVKELINLFKDSKTSNNIRHQEIFNVIEKNLY